MLWITGAKGLLGSTLCAQCKSALHLKTGREVDISDREMVRAFVRQHLGITHIVNAAAFSLVDPSEIRREEAFRANAIGPENLALVAQEMGAKLVHISTDFVFPGDVKRPLTEDDRVGPCNYYGETKLEGERRALALGACVIRVSWLFGHGGKNFVSRLLELLQTEKEIRLTNDQWNRPTYTPDFAEAIFAMKDQKGLYQYANEGVATKYEFAVAMREEAMRLGYRVKTEKLIPVPSTAFPSPCQRPIYSAFDTTKIEQFVPIRPWREALRDFLCAQQPACL